MTRWVSAASRFRVRVLGKAETWEGLMTHKIHFVRLSQLTKHSAASLVTLQVFYLNLTLVA